MDNPFSTPVSSSTSPFSTPAPIGHTTTAVAIIAGACVATGAFVGWFGHSWSQGAVVTKAEFDELKKRLDELEFKSRVAEVEEKRS
jgi:hypothetical protein